MIDPAGIPLIPSDVAALATHGRTLMTMSSQFADTGAQIDSTWQKLDPYYKAPEEAQLFAVTNPVMTRSASVGTAIYTVGDALLAYADEIEPLQSQLATLQADAQNVVSEIGCKGDEWTEDEDLVSRHQAILDGVNAAFSAWQAAERTCANKIIALWCGTQYVEDNADSLKASWEYGYSEAFLDSALANGAELPWGTAEEFVDDWYIEFAEGVNLAWTDTLNGLGTLVGLNGADAMGQGWEGLGTFVWQHIPGLAVANLFVDVPGFEGKSTWEIGLETWDGLLGFDEWSKSGWKGGGYSFFNIATMIGTEGIVASLKGTTIAVKAATLATKFPKIGAIAAKLPTLIDLVADPTNIIGFVKLPSLKGLIPSGTAKAAPPISPGALPNPDAPWPPKAWPPPDPIPADTPRPSSGEVPSLTPGGMPGATPFDTTPPRTPDATTPESPAAMPDVWSPYPPGHGSVPTSSNPAHIGTSDAIPPTNAGLSGSGSPTPIGAPDEMSPYPPGHQSAQDPDAVWPPPPDGNVIPKANPPDYQPHTPGEPLSGNPKVEWDLQQTVVNRPDLAKIDAFRGDLIPDRAKLVWWDGGNDGITFRGDGRLPETVYKDGLTPRRTDEFDLEAYRAGNQPSVYLSTAIDPDAARGFAASYDGYMYVIDAPGGLDLNKTFGPDVFRALLAETEISRPGGVKPERIYGHFELQYDPKTGRFELGRFTENPHFKPMPGGMEIPVRPGE